MEPAQNNVACKEVVTIEIPPPRARPPTRPPEAPPPGAPPPVTPPGPVENPCRQPNPAWVKNPGPVGGLVSINQDPLDDIETTETRLFNQSRAALIAQWTAEVQAACQAANPGHECTGSFDSEPVFTYDRHPAPLNAMHRRPYVVIELRLLNTIRGTCR